MRIAIVGITRHGAARAAELAQKMPAAHVLVSEKFSALFCNLPNQVKSYSGALKDEVGTLFAQYDEIVFFVSLGAVVRLIAPYLKSKDEDPGVLVVDDNARFVIPVLSGHVGGANALAEKVAELLHATAVITTASDVGKTIPVDILGRELGWKVVAPKINITRVSAHVVNGEPIAFVQEAGAKNWWTRATALPPNIRLFDRFEDVDPAAFRAVLWVTRRPIQDTLWHDWQERLVVYRPPLVALGLGCDRGASLDTLEDAVRNALLEIKLDYADVGKLASIDKKSDEAGIVALAEKQGWETVFYSARELAKIEVPNPSATVLKYMGTPSVSEAAALLAADGDGWLLEKYKYLGRDGKNATVSIARMK